MRSRARIVATVAGVTVGGVLVLGSCGIGTSGEVEPVEEDILQALDPTNPTTTTTTTEPVPTTPPGTPTPQPPGSSTTTNAPPVTTPAEESFTLYFLDGEQLVGVDVALSNGSPRRRLEVLGEGPPEAHVDAGIRSAVPLGLVRTVRLQGEVFTIDLNEEEYGTIDPDDQRYMTGQIVLTLTEDDPMNQVRFTLDDEPLRVFRRDGSPSEPGETVGRDDYTPLLDVATRAVDDDG